MAVEEEGLRVFQSVKIKIDDGVTAAVTAPLGFLEEHSGGFSETERGLLGLLVRTVWGTQETGNYPPIHFLIGWKRLQKNCVFSCMATS
ncbi:hypothetical protein INR49_016322 [Caranx melampygus]|nr:hypothetical protein INR49_016322 [Caranx melampygus]